MDLEEAVVRRRAAEQTLGQRARVWSVRALLNVLVLALLGAAFYGIYWATEYTLTLQVRRVLKEEGPWVLEPTFPQVEKPCGSELGSRIPGILGSFKIRRGYRWTFSLLLSLSHTPFQETPLVQQTPLLKLLVDYLPSIFISVFNFVLPPVFKFIASLEGYTHSRQIVLILLRFWTHGMG